MTKCTHCGQENDDAALRCVCGQDQQEVAAPASAVSPATEASPAAAALAQEPRLVLRKVLFVVGTLALVAAYSAVRYRIKTNPLNSSLVITGIWCAVAVAGLWFLGRERRPMLRAWRIAFLVRSVYLLPLILNLTDGLMEFGWPTGRFNRSIAAILTPLTPLVGSVFLTGLVAHIRAYRVAAVLAMLSGAASIVLGGYLFPATASLVPLSITLGDVLNNVMFAAKVERYIAIPLGMVYILGGIMTLRAAYRARA